jgi:hypothetical protein
MTGEMFTGDNLADAPIGSRVMFTIKDGEGPYVEILMEVTGHENGEVQLKAVKE